MAEPFKFIITPEHERIKKANAKANANPSPVNYHAVMVRRRVEELSERLVINAWDEEGDYV